MNLDVASRAHSTHKFRLVALGQPAPGLDHLIQSLGPEFLLQTLPKVSIDNDLVEMESDMFVLQLQDASALSTFSALRTLPELQDVPVVFITDSADGTQEEALLDQGAAEVLHLPCHPGVTRARIRARLRVANRLRRLAAMSGIDPVTRLPSKRSFMKQIERELGRARRLQRPLSILVFELNRPDHGKRRAPARIPDRVLSLMAQTIESNLNRSTDFACHYRPEQVLVVLPETDEPGAWQVARRLSQAINQALAGLSPEGDAARVRCNVSSSVPGRLSSSAGLLRDAFLASDDGPMADIIAK